MESVPVPPTGEPTSMLVSFVVGTRMSMEDEVPVTEAAPPLKSISSEIRSISPSVRITVLLKSMRLLAIMSMLPADTDP
jgi:hypothetical protein